MNDDGGGALERNRRLMDQYLPSHDTAYMSEDVVARIMASGQEYKGRAEVDAMFAYFYGGGAFDAHAEMRSSTVGENSAAAEADVVRRHTGEFAGVPATGAEIRVPLSVHYDIRDDQIIAIRVYFEVPVFLAQVQGSAPASH